MKIRTNLLVVRAVLDARAEGMTFAAIAERAGVAETTVWKWVRYAKTQPQGWPTPADIEACQLEAIRLGEKRARNAARAREYAKRRYLARGRLMVPSLGTARRLQALAALGWTAYDLAPRLGVTPSRVGHMTTGLYAQVYRDTAARVAQVYDELSMQVPVDPEKTARYMVRVHERQRRMALLKGYAPPLAWEDIDDPAERPSGHQRRTLTRAEVLEELDDAGKDIRDACARLRISRDGLEQWCRRHDLTPLYSRLVRRVDPEAYDVAVGAA